MLFQRPDSIAETKKINQDIEKNIFIIRINFGGSVECNSAIGLPSGTYLALLCGRPLRRAGQGVHLVDSGRLEKCLLRNQRPQHDAWISRCPFLLVRIGRSWQRSHTAETCFRSGSSKRWQLLQSLVLIVDLLLVTGAASLSVVTAPVLTEFSFFADAGDLLFLATRFVSILLRYLQLFL